MTTHTHKESPMETTARSTMLIGLLLSATMGGLLLAWTAGDRIESVAAMVYLVGIVTGLVTVLIGATRRPRG